MKTPWHKRRDRLVFVSYPDWQDDVEVAAENLKRTALRLGGEDCYESLAADRLLAAVVGSSLEARQAARRRHVSRLYQGPWKRYLAPDIWIGPTRNDPEDWVPP